MWSEVAKTQTTTENEKEWNGMSHATTFYNEWKQDQDKGIQHTFTAEEVVLVS